MATAGLALQFVRPDDPTPPLRYFTIWSALGVAVSEPLAGLRKPPWMGALSRVFRTGAVASGAVYVLALAPINGWGNSDLTIGANVVLHAALPAAVILCTKMNASPRRTITQEVSTLAFPLSYFAATEIAQLTTDYRSPYVFLQLGQGGVVIASAGAGFVLLWLGIIALFRKLER